MIDSITEYLKGYFSENLGTLKRDLRENLRKDLRQDITTVIEQIKQRNPGNGDHLKGQMPLVKIQTLLKNLALRMIIGYIYR